MARRPYLLVLALVLSVWLVAPVLGQTCAAAPSNPGDRRPNKAALRVASYNVEWLFDGIDRRAPWQTPAEAEAHLQAVAVSMVRVNADIFALQEVQNCAMLQRLVNAMAARGRTGYNFFLVPGTDTATGQNTAIVTRVDIVAPVTRSANRATWPIAGNTCNYNGGQTGTTGISKHMLASFIVNNRRIGLFTSHYLAFPTMGDRCVQREAQSTVARGLINERIAAGEQMIVLGDFNDYSDRVPDAVNNRPTSRVIRIMRDGVLSDSETFGNFSKSGNLTAAGNAVLYEVSVRINQPQRYTAVFNSGRSVSQIDHILMSDSLRTLVTAASIDHTDAPNAVSDHWPIIVDFRV